MKFIFLGLMAFSCVSYADGLTEVLMNPYFTLSVSGLNKPSSAESDFRTTNAHGKTTYGYKNTYMLSYEKRKRGYKVVEVARISNSSEAPQSAIAITSDGSQVTSFTTCAAYDNKNVTNGNTVSAHCSTATPRVCDALMKFEDKTQMDIGRLTLQCDEFNKLQNNLADLMSSTDYKKISDENTEDIADQYYAMAYPKSGVLDVLRDAKVSKNETYPIKKVDFNSRSTLWNLNGICAKYYSATGQAINAEELKAIGNSKSSYRKKGSAGSGGMNGSSGSWGGPGSEQGSK